MKIEVSLQKEMHTHHLLLSVSGTLDGIVENGLQ